MAGLFFYLFLQKKHHMAKDECYAKKLVIEVWRMLRCIRMLQAGFAHCPGEGVSNRLLRYLTG